MAKLKVTESTKRAEVVISVNLLDDAPDMKIVKDDQAIILSIDKNEQIQLQAGNTEH
jgi:hypothetical protein